MSRIQLHRTTGQADWLAVPPHSYTIWQRLAARTHGIVTLSNVVTIVGFALVLIGLEEILNRRYLSATVLLAIGRFCDILDGWLAELTRTKSPLGELLDAAIDKILTILTVATFYVAHIAPAWVLVALVTPHVLIVVILLAWRIRKRVLHPSLVGKLSMAGVWLSLLIYALAQIVDLPAAAMAATQVIVVASSVAGLYAAAQYIRGRD
ncbi:MAG TPA: CDP-alcohol phosphatidyltransferase family protein [Mycobacterium sp.]